MSSIWSARDMSSSESLGGIGASVKAGGGREWGDALVPEDDGPGNFGFPQSWGPLEDG